MSNVLKAYVAVFSILLKTSYKGMTKVNQRHIFHAMV